MNSPTPNAWLPAPLRRLAGRALERALAHLMALDPETREQLAVLEGRTVTLHLTGPELALAIRVEQGVLKVGPASEPSHLKLKASPFSLLAMALPRDEDTMAPGKIEIAGDAELARRLEKLARQFAPDFEEAWTRQFGDVLGVPLARAFRAAFTQLKNTAERLTEDTVDWLRDESRLNPARGEVETFLDGVDELRERSERLESRLKRLAENLARRSDA